MLIIKCAKCKRKIIKYRKIGAGKVLRCFKERISQYYQQQKNADLECQCGNVIGIDDGNHYRMKQNSFTYTGTKE